ncbi:MAG TPA: serine hydrolase [Hyphomicrobiaceae bacterium]|nr:serine hydrolase [Hyphomicrobiaceae bacterium]
MAMQARQRPRLGISAAAILALLVLVAWPLTLPAHADGKSAILVVDANTGRVLHESAADAPRHPASLAKMMTLYLAFERIEQGRLSYQTKIRISANAAAAAPTKLELAEGDEIILIDAIKALITKSANDLAIAIAEHIAGSEEKFAKLMTQKARQLGMTATVFRNASGLPDEEQVTTARDMVTLALHLQDDFPRHYPLFATRTFTYRGETLYNHNTLLEDFEGTDGIKTGYTRASGFNLVASVRRGRKHVVGAIFGGVSATARNAAMRTFLSLGLVKASSVKTRQPGRLVVAQVAPQPARNIGPVPVPRRVERPGRETANAAPPPAAAPNEARQGPAIEIARVRTVRLSPGPVHPTTAERASSAAPLDEAERSRVRAAADDGAPGPQPKWTTASAANPPGYATATSEMPAHSPGGASGLGATPSTLQAQAANLARGEAPILTAPPSRVQPRLAAAPAPVGPFHIQIGAYQSLDEAQKRLASARKLAPGLLARRSPVTSEVKQGNKLFYRARFAGFEAAAAAGACTELKRLKIDCLVMKAQ